jgi:hypothetical protein
VAKTILIDGYKFEVDDALETAVSKLQGQLKDATEAKDAAETKVGELTATVSTKDGEIAALEQKVKDASLSPEQIEKLVADRSALIAQAKAIDPNVVTDGKTEVEIRKAIVSAKLGDAAKDMNDGAIAGAFTVLAKDVKIDPVRSALSGGVTTIADAEADYGKAMEERRKQASTAWKTPATAAAA